MVKKVYNTCWGYKQVQVYLRKSSYPRAITDEIPFTGQDIRSRTDIELSSNAFA